METIREKCRNLETAMIGKMRLKNPTLFRHDKKRVTRGKVALRIESEFRQPLGGIEIVVIEVWRRAASR